MTQALVVPDSVFQSLSCSLGRNLTLSRSDSTQRRSAARTPFRQTEGGREGEQKARGEGEADPSLGTEEEDGGRRERERERKQSEILLEQSSVQISRITEKSLLLCSPGCSGGVEGRWWRRRRRGGRGSAVNIAPKGRRS